MKKIIVILGCCLIFMSSCRKSGVNLFVGDYSYKTSGEVTLRAEAVINENEIPIPAMMNASISNDIGQLSINVSDKGNNEVLVVINHMNGEVITTTGTCDGNTIVLDEFQRNTLPISINTFMSPSSTYITVSGTGRMYDDLILFDVKISGETTIGSVTYNLRDNNVITVAYRN